MNEKRMMIILFIILFLGTIIGLLYINNKNIEKFVQLTILLILYFGVEFLQLIQKKKQLIKDDTSKLETIIKEHRLGTKILKSKIKKIGNIKDEPNEE